MIADILKDTDSRMRKAMDALHHNLESVRTGRASPSLVERIHVDYYGASTPLNQLAGISVPESRLIVIQPWDRGSIGPIEKAIMQSDLGLNPNNDGQVIRIAIPMLTEDRRKQMVKVVHGTTEECKVAVRNIRRDALSQVKDLANKKEVSEDDERRASQEVETLTKKYVDEADKIGKAKEQEVLEV
ncbi:MAG: ribosome recycling factor [Chloroflexia bacterium]|nr:ribosome recycling factor [Chloroflexia bacterium]